MKHQVLMLSIFVILVFSLVPSTFAEESVNLATTTRATLHYSSSYDKMQADADTSITLQSDEHLYNPGDAGIVEGTVSSNVITGLGEALSLITITVVDANGKIIVEEESEISDGEYFAIFTIPNDAAPGQYTVTSKIEADADVLDLIGL